MKRTSYNKNKFQEKEIKRNFEKKNQKLISVGNLKYEKLVIQIEKLSDSRSK